MVQLNLNLGDIPEKRVFKSPFTALMSRLENKNYNWMKETAILKSILKKGFTDKQIDLTVNYIKFKNLKIDSFALLLWKDCQLIKEAVTNTEWMTKPVEEKVKLTDQDFRTNKDYIKPKKSKKDFLS